MATFTPVDDDPFGTKPKLTPVDHDPFADPIPREKTRAGEMSPTDKKWVLKQRYPPGGRLGAAVRSVTREIFPTATGAAGATTGAAIGALAPPPFDLATVPFGILAGGVAGGYAGKHAQEGALSAVPKVAETMGQTPAQVDRDVHAYPVTTGAAGFAPALVMGGALQRGLTPEGSRAAEVLLPAKPTVSDRINATRAAAQRQGVTLPGTVTSPTAYRASRLLPKVLGTGVIEKVEGAAPKNIGDRVQQLADTYGVSTERGAAGEKLQDSAARWAEKQRVAGGDLIEKAEAGAAGIPLAATQTAKYLDEKIDEALVNPETNRPLITMLTKLKSDLTTSPGDLKALRNLRGSLYNTSAPEGLEASYKAKVAGDLWQTLSTDIENGLVDASTNNPKALEALGQFREGSAIWTKRQNTIKSTLAKVLGSNVQPSPAYYETEPTFISAKAPEEAWDAVKKMTTDDRRAFQKLMGTLDPSAQSSVKASIIGSLGRDDKGLFNASNFLSDMHAIPERTRVLLFGRENVKALDDLHTITANLSQTDPRHGGWGAYAIEGLLGTALGLPHGAEGVAGGLGATLAATSGMAHMLARPDSLKWITKLAGATAKGREAFGAQVEALGKAANTNASIEPLYNMAHNILTMEPNSKAAAQKGEDPGGFDPSKMTDEELDALIGDKTPSSSSEGGDASGVTIDPTAYPNKPVEELIPAVAHVESRDNPAAVSPKGAEGTMQVMPTTQTDPGFGVAPVADASDAEKTRTGEDYLRAMIERHGGNQVLALMSYNWGPGNVDHWVKGGMKGRVPRETRDYVHKLLGN